jgi:hypothetical protein
MASFYGKPLLRETGMNTLELIVEPGEELDLADHANWASLRVLKIE